MRFIFVLLWAFISLSSSVALAEIKEGDKLKTLANLHPDPNRRLIYTTNYQLFGLIPMCSDITVNDISKKKMIFDLKGVEYTVSLDGPNKKAGVTLEQFLGDFFGSKCDEDKVKKMSKLDQEGVRVGKPKVGMTRQGIIYAMGRPPRHANPDLETPSWMYWANKFNKTAIEFSEKGIVSNVRD